MPFTPTVLIPYAKNYFSIITILSLKQPNIELERGFFAVSLELK